MNNRNKFRFYLRAENGEYYTMAGKNVVTTAVPTPLRSDPIEWSDLDLRWVRNVKYHGVFRQFIVPLSFVQDGATILRHIFNTQEGIESKCTFYIEQKKQKTAYSKGDESYVFYYSGDIDFSLKNDTDSVFQVGVLDRGLAALMKAKERTPFEIQVYGIDALNVYLDGLRLKNTTVITLANDFAATNTWQQMMPTMLIQSPSESEIQVDVIQQVNQLGLGTAQLINDYPFFQATIDGTVTIDYDINIMVTNPGSFSLGTSTYKMMIYKKSGGVSTPIPLYAETNPSIYIGHNNRAYGTISIQVLAGDTLSYFSGLDPFSIMNGTGTTPVTHTYSYSTMKLYYDLRLPPSVVRAYRYYQLFQKFVTAMTTGAYGSRSDFLSNSNNTTLDNKPWNTLCLSGDGLRRLGWLTGFYSAFNFLTYEKITTTFEDLHRDAAYRWMTGIGVEKDASGNDIIRLEHLSHFYQNTVIADLGEVKDLQRDVADEYIHHLLKIGYAPYEYDKLNGRSEPNTTHTYSLPIFRHQNDWDMVCAFRSDMHGVEYQRALRLQKPTTDSKSDNDTFVIEVEDGPIPVTLAFPSPAFNGIAYPLARKQNNTGNSASGLLAPDRAFNLSLTPKRNLLRNGPLIAAALHQQDNKLITFQTTDKNADLVSNLGSFTIPENGDVRVSDLGRPLFLPMLFMFETMVPADLPQLLEANPYGMIRFKWRNPGTDALITLKGFIVEVGIKPANNAVYRWKLLASADTDLSKLTF